MELDDLDPVPALDELDRRSAALLADAHPDNYHAISLKNLREDTHCATEYNAPKESYARLSRAYYNELRRLEPYGPSTLKRPTDDDFLQAIAHDSAEKREQISNIEKADWPYATWRLRQIMQRFEIAGTAVERCAADREILTLSVETGHYIAEAAKTEAAKAKPATEAFYPIMLLGGPVFVLAMLAKAPRDVRVIALIAAAVIWFPSLIYYMLKWVPKITEDIFKWESKIIDDWAPKIIDDIRKWVPKI
jgi:hypothetical protein